MMYFPWVIKNLETLFGKNLWIDFNQERYQPIEYIKKEKRTNPKVKAIPKYQEALDKLERWITLRQYSYHTLRSYRFAFRKFLFFYNDKDPRTLTK